MPDDVVGRRGDHATLGVRTTTRGAGIVLTPERFEFLQGWARDLIADGHSEGGAMRELIQEIKRLHRQMQKAPRRRAKTVGTVGTEASKEGSEG